MTSLLEPLGRRVSGVRKIAVLRSNSMGDFVVALPALEALRAAYPSAQLTYLGTDWHPNLLIGRPGPWDRVVVVPPYPGVRDSDETTRTSPEVAAFFREQQREGYDLAVQLHGGGGNSNPFVSNLGARVTIGSRAPDAPPLDRCIPYVYYQHEVLRFLEVVGLVGAAPVGLEPHLTVTAEDRAAAADAVPPSDFPPSPLVAIHPGATDPRRRWSPDGFAAVADRLAERGADVVVIGHGETDARAARHIVAASTGAKPLDLVNALSLPALTGLLERCRLVVANDSGPRHLAAAVGTATVGIYWCGNLINAGPLTRSRHRIGVSFRTACPECGADQGQGRCEHDPSFVDEVPAELVIRECLDLYDAEAPAAPATIMELQG
jgi:ADP-heptose:LPS heptosyltransferase